MNMMMMMMMMMNFTVSYIINLGIIYTVQIRNFNSM